MKCVSCLCIALLLLPTAEAQRVTKGGWGEVQSVTPGRKVRVHRFPTDAVPGEFRSASVGSITVATETGEITVPRADVREVKLRRVSGRLKNAGIGAAIGAGVGTGLGLAVTGGDLDGLGSAVLALLTTVGTFAGFGLGLIPPGYGTIYKAEQP